MAYDYNYILIGLTVIGVIATIVLFRSIKRAILRLFGGSIELSEAAGVLFAGLFTHMILLEGQRTHEWHIYNELYIFFTAGAAMTGLGLKQTLDTIKEIRMGSNSSSTIIETQTQKKEVVKNESGE
jgi:hypothetical protein